MSLWLHLYLSGGLAEEVDEKVLHAAFIPFGDIIDIQIPLDYETGTVVLGLFYSLTLNVWSTWMLNFLQHLGLVSGLQKSTEDLPLLSLNWQRYVLHKLTHLFMYSLLQMSCMLMIIMMNQFIFQLQDSAAAIDNMVSGFHHFPLIFMSRTILVFEAPRCKKEKSKPVWPLLLV